jgi:methylmalonyl-CoA/ethylmalonyl-CoA epimerase
MPYTIPPVSSVRFDHIAIAVPRIADVPGVLAGELGGAPWYGARLDGYTFAQWRFEGGGRLEALEPAGADGFLHRFLRARGPGIHHVTFRVPSLFESCRRAEDLGYEIVGYDDSNASWKQAFLHPRQALGIVVQLAETGPRGGEGSPPRFDPPPGPPAPPPPVRLLGLRMRVRSTERARLLWERVLEGECLAQPEGTLVCRWPGSPLCLVIEVAPGAVEGPLAIEFAAGRPVPLPRGPHPVLGVAFVQRA